MEGRQRKAAEAVHASVHHGRQLERFSAMRARERPGGPALQLHVQRAMGARDGDHANKPGHERLVVWPKRRITARRHSPLIR